MLAKTAFGMEEILAAELLKLGARNIEQRNRAVSFTGDKGFMYKANLCLRTALRILKPITHFEVSDENDFYEKIQKINWEKYLEPQETLAVDTALNTDLFNHSQYISQKTKDAIVDKYREKYGVRPDVDLDNPTLRINIHIFQTTCTVSLDSSGDALYKRGYRENINLAPLNEVLAAAMVILSGWNKHSVLVDPMCGSGTILIEAAMYANNIPPGCFREQFGFEKWKDFDADLWQVIYDAAIDKIDSLNPEIRGCDISPNIIKKAKKNIKTAKVDDVVSVQHCSFQDFEPPAAKGVVIFNPPYGERMVKDNIEELYKEIGSTMKKKYSGYDVWIISSNIEAIHAIGLRPSRKITLFNGALECKFLKYEMYQGTKKIHKLVKED